MTNPYLIGADGRGILPESAWPSADKVIKEARKLVPWLKQRLEDRFFIPGIGLSKDHYLGLIATFEKNVENFGAILEKLKYDPAFVNTSNNPDRIRDWFASVSDFPRWAKEIDDSADFSSLTGAINEVVIKSGKDLVQAVANVGKNTLLTLKWLPWVAGFGIIGIGGMWLWDRIKKK